MFNVDGDHHINGWATHNREGHTSSAIQSFDPATRTAITFSGRRYQLVGEPGTDADARYVWEAWCQLPGIDADTVIDVSDQYAAPAAIEGDHS